eukprot:Gb_17623 [translate_table: standard]
MEVGRSTELGNPAEGHTISGDASPPHKIAVRTRSETDFLDDGYSWKKYGQKYIKGSPYKRCYFKCRGKECGVKKQSQRCGDAPEFVLTTYQGTHNHPPKSAISSELRNSYDLRAQLRLPKSSEDRPGDDGE